MFQQLRISRVSNPMPGGMRVDWFPLVRSLLGVILLVAAGLKSSSDPLMAQAILGVPNVVLVLGELAFAAVLFSGRQPDFSWWACIACFASFAIFAGYKVINGDSDCGCFGAVSPPPTAALGIDLTVLSVLCVVGKPGTSSVSVPCGAGFQCYFSSMVRIITMPFRFGVIVGIAVICSPLAADDFLDWTAAVQANEDHAAGVIGSFRIQSTNDFVRVSQTTREANAELGVNVDLPVIQIVEVDVRGRWMLQRRKNGKGTEFVTGQNSRYVFDIEKAAGGSSYTITRLEYRSADVTLDPDVSEHRFTIFPECYAFGENLKQLMLDPGFRFGKVSEVLGIDGKKLKRISFEYVPTTEARMQIENATIDCDAAQGWTIVGGKGDLWKSTIKDYEFTNTGTTPEGVKKMTILVPAGDPDSCRRTIHVVESLDRVPQEAEFFLAYYGLREPGVAATWSIRWIVLVILGVAIIWFSIKLGKRRAVGR